VTELVGILNLTEDSFSDGGRFVDPARALEHARRLAADGASWIDVGAESTHPDAAKLSEPDEIARLEPVVARLLAEGLRVSVDTWKPGVMRRMLALGCGMINDVRGFRAPGAIEAVRDGDALLVAMHSTSHEARASREPSLERTSAAGGGVVARIAEFLEARLAELTAAGVDEQRVILDPGMGFFLSPDPAVSFAVLRGLAELRRIGRPLFVCTSRKSFLGAHTGRAVGERGAATLASELYACRAGVDYVRTHDVRALSDGLRTEAAIRGGG